MGVGEASSKLKKVARRMAKVACVSFSKSTSSSISSFDSAISVPAPAPAPAPAPLSPTKPNTILKAGEETMKKAESPTKTTTKVTSKNLCAICLEALSYSTGESQGEAIFTAQCSHAFHFGCISSNVRHGSITCPICRAQWTQLPRNLKPPASSLSTNLNDPVFRILDDSIATFRVHRRSFLLSARYDDDDPIEPDQTRIHPRLDFSLIPIPASVLTHPYSFDHQVSTNSASLQIAGTGHSSNHFHRHNNFANLLASSVLLEAPERQTTSYMPSVSYRRAAYLAVKLTHPQSTDLVLVASPNGPHLRLLKQTMAMVVYSLRAIDRLAIVTYSSAAARVFPLRRMTSCGKRTALQVIDRLFYMGQADPIEGLKKGIKILEDRTHKNPHSGILHLSDSPTRSFHAMNTSMNSQVRVPIHRFHVGLGYGTSNGFVMHEFEEFLERLLGGAVGDIFLRIKEEGRMIRLGELREGEERRFLVELGENGQAHVEYSYIEGGIDTFIRTGETIVGIGDKREASNDIEAGIGRRDMGIIGGRSSSVERWEYHDPYMARRWAKHLHSYRL